MIRVSELSGAWLDYWVARADGVPAEQLEVRPIQRSTDFHCVRKNRFGAVVGVLNYSTNWDLCGPLVDMHDIDLALRVDMGGWFALPHRARIAGRGDAPRAAICRAVIIKAFGEEVPEEKS